MEYDSVYTLRQALNWFSKNPTPRLPHESARLKLLAYVRVGVPQCIPGRSTCFAPGVLDAYAFESAYCLRRARWYGHTREVFWTGGRLRAPPLLGCPLDAIIDRGGCTRSPLDGSNPTRPAPCCACTCSGCLLASPCGRALDHPPSSSGVLVLLSPPPTDRCVRPILGAVFKIPSHERVVGLAATTGDADVVIPLWAACRYCTQSIGV